MLVRWDFFHRTENRRGPKPIDAPGGHPCYSVDLDRDLTLAQALEQAYAAGVPRGSHRAGCFEVQSAKGIWTSPNGKRIDPATAKFIPWD